MLGERGPSGRAHDPHSLSQDPGVSCRAGTAASDIGRRIPEDHSGIFLLKSLTFPVNQNIITYVI